MKTILIILVSLLICSSCSYMVETQPVQTTKTIENTHVFITPTVTKTRIPTPSVLVTPTLEPLSSGVYFVCYSHSPSNTRLTGSFQAIAPVDSSSNPINIRLSDWGSIDFAPVGLQYAYITPDFSALYIVDVLNNLNRSVPNQNNCDYRSIEAWSNDATRMLLSCREENNGLMVLNPSNGNLEGVVPPPDNRESLIFLKGLWSPNGKWIAYTATELKPNILIGPYLTSTDCLENTSECQGKVINISACKDQCQFWWTNDSLLAVDYSNSYPNEIGFFDPQTGALVRNEDLGGVDNLADYSWSPDGRYLVIENTRENGARVVKEITSGEVLFDLDDVGCDLFLGWLSIP